MSTAPRRSQRIASATASKNAKNAASVAASKASSAPFTILTGPGQSGKSPLVGSARTTAFSLRPLR